MEIETKNEGAYIDFWKALRHVVSFDLHRRNHIMSGLHKSVMSDVQSLIGGKNSSELKHLLDDIRKDVREGRRTDIEYWEQMEREVDVEHSRAIVREIHSDLQSQQQAIIAHYEAVSIEGACPSKLSIMLLYRRKKSGVRSELIRRKEESRKDRHLQNTDLFHLLPLRCKEAW